MVKMPEEAEKGSAEEQPFEEYSGEMRKQEGGPLVGVVSLFPKVVSPAPIPEVGLVSISKLDCSFNEIDHIFGRWITN